MAGRRYLVDTNIFVEILLQQTKEADCINFVTSNFHDIAISQYSIHSIALICYRKKNITLFTTFVNDIIDNIEVITLNNAALKDIENIILQYRLDYDDAYQLKAAQLNNFELVTMDQDFSKVSSIQKILFI